MKAFAPLILSLTLPLLAAAQDVRSGIVSYWPLDELSGDGLTTPDKVAGSDLTLVNMDAGNVVPGMRGNAMSFDGFEEFVWRDTFAGPNPGLPLHANLRKTICFWVKGDGTIQADRRIFAEASMASNTPLYDVGTDNAGSTARLDLLIRNDTATPVNHIKTVGLPLNNDWHHVAVTDDNGAVKFYIDGVLDATTVNYTRGTSNFTTLSLGAIQRMTGPGFFFSGAIDDVAVWNRVLQASEIQTVMNNGIATPVPPLVSLETPGPFLQGDRVKLSAQFPGTEMLSWQWKRNNADIPGATESTLVIPSLTAATSGEYSVQINGSAPAAAVTLTFTADPAAALTANLVSWWGFDTLNEAEFPPITPDPWGGDPLSCQDIEAVNLVPGQFGNAMQFDGFTELAYRTSGFPITSNPEYSVAFWVKADGTVQNDLRVFAEGSNLTNTPLFAIGTATDSSDHLRMYVRSDANTVLVARDSESAVFNDSWHHVVWTDRNGNARLYVDGVQDGTSFKYTRTGQTFTLNQTSVGAIQRAFASNWLLSTVDDVAVWNRALTWTEIQQLKSTGVPAPVTAVAPEITVEPVGRTLWAGRVLTLSVQVTGTAPFTYEWSKGGSPVPGSPNAATLMIDPSQVSDSGSYTCKVTNSAGSDTSAAASVTVKAISGIDSGRVSFWPLDGGETTTPDIISGFNLDLRNMDPFSAYQPAVKANGMLFDGLDDLLVHTRTGTGGDIPLTNRDEFTVSFWVNGIGTGQLDRRVFSESSTLNTNPLFNMGTDNLGTSDLLDFFIRSDGGGVPVNHAKSFSPVFDGAWHHVIYTDYLGQGQLFVDGLPDVTLSYPRPVSTFTNITVGGIGRATPSHWFAGMVDEVCTWERALTIEEAEQWFQSQPVPESLLFISGARLVGGNLIELTVTTSFGNAFYEVQSTTNPATIPWGPENTAFFGPVTGGVFTVEIPIGPDPRKFYKVLAP